MATVKNQLKLDLETYLALADEIGGVRQSYHGHSDQKRAEEVLRSLARNIATKFGTPTDKFLMACGFTVHGKNG